MPGHPETQSSFHIKLPITQLMPTESELSAKYTETKAECYLL